MPHFKGPTFSLTANNFLYSNDTVNSSHFKDIGRCRQILLIAEKNKKKKGYMGLTVWSPKRLMITFLVLEEKRINARSSLNLNFKLQIMLLNQCLWRGNIGESILQRKYVNNNLFQF